MSTENQSNRKSKKKKTPVETIPSTPEESKDENIISSQDTFDGWPINYINSLSSNPKFNLNLDAYRKLLAGEGYLAMKKGLEPRLVKNVYKLAAASTKLRLNKALNLGLYTDLIEYLHDYDFFKQRGYWPNQNVIRFDFTKPFTDFYSCGRLNEGSLLFQHSNNIAKSIPSIAANSSIFDPYNGLGVNFFPNITPLSELMKSPFFRSGETPYPISAAREFNDHLALTGQINSHSNQGLYGTNTIGHSSFVGNDWARGIGAGLHSYMNPITESTIYSYNNLGKIPSPITSAWMGIDGFENLFNYISINANQQFNGYGAKSVYANYGVNDWARGIGSVLPSYINLITESRMDTYNNLGKIPVVNSSALKFNDGSENLSNYIGINAKQLFNGYIPNTVNADHGLNDWSKGIGSVLPSYINSMTESRLAAFNNIVNIPDSNPSAWRVNDHLFCFSNKFSSIAHQHFNSYNVNTVYTINGVYDGSKGVGAGLPSYFGSLNEAMNSPYFNIGQTLGSNSYCFRSGDHIDYLNGFLGIRNSKLEWNSLSNQNLGVKDLSWNSHKNGGIWESITQIPAQPKKEEEYLREKVIIKIITSEMKKFITEAIELVVPQKLEQVLNKMDRLEGLMLSNVSHTLMQANTEEDYIDRLEVMAILNISESTFYRECKKWNPHRVGNKSLFLRSEIFKLTRYYLK